MHIMIYGGSVSEILLKALLYKCMRYKDVEKMLREKTGREIREKTIRNTLSKLKKKGLISNGPTGWEGTLQAEIYLAGHEPFFPHFGKQTKEVRKKKKDLMVMFDIPEEYKNKRDWLRVELMALGFEQIQKSVWHGPSPLPMEFIEAIKAHHLVEYLKFFKAAKQEIV